MSTFFWAICWGMIGAAVAFSLMTLSQRFVGFAAQTPADYADAGDAPLDLRRHMAGALICDGVIYGPMGRVTSRFTAVMEARWEGNRGTMTEHFRYDSGATQHRRWDFQLGDDGFLRATAPDLVGEAVGRVSGPTAMLRYRLRLPEDAGGHVLNATDWMYLAPNGSIVNRSQFRKFGFKVAELVAVMRRKDMV